MRDWHLTLLTQYANSPRLRGLIEAINAAVDPEQDIDDFFALLWNIDTAQGFGLDVWGRIVGVKRSLYIPGGIAGEVFGFIEGGGRSFGESPFVAKAEDNYDLSDDAYRRLILVKAASNIADRSIPSFNRALAGLFPGRGNAYVRDLGNMQAALTFEFLLTPVERALLEQSGAFEGPTGVDMQVDDYDVPFVFGFAEAGLAPFNQGAFAS